MKVVFLCYFNDFAAESLTYSGPYYEWDAWMTQEDYECKFHPGNPQDAKEPGIDREDDGSIYGFDIIAEISDDWKDEIPEGREDEYSDDVHPALWEGIRAVFPHDGEGVIFTQETLEDYSKRFPQIYADAFDQEVVE